VGSLGICSVQANVRRAFAEEVQAIDSRLGFLRVEGIDITSHQHVRQHQILQHLYSLWRSRFIVLLERFKEIRRCFIPRAFGHPHFPTAFPDDTHDTGMRNRRSNTKGGFIDALKNTMGVSYQRSVQLRGVEGADLEFLRFAQFTIHLDLNSIHLEH
jgi:hypothetical protein